MKTEFPQEIKEIRGLCAWAKQTPRAIDTEQQKITTWVTLTS